MDTIELPPDFREFLKLLRSHGVRYLLVGGYAVNYYGYWRSTDDLDVWIAVGPENATRLVETLKEFGFGSTGLSPDLFLDPKKMIRMGAPPVRLEILNSISGVDFETCYRDRITAEVDGVDVDLISLEHLKQNKAASGRYKDLDDLEHLNRPG